MPLVNELDLPVLDYTDPALRGDRFHETLAELGSIQGIYGVDRLPIRWDLAPAA